jgi:4-amino-4-deoxychorismate lyase
MTLAADDRSPVWVNGVATRAVDALDRGLQFGDGCFETLSCVAGKVRWLAQHLIRLRTGCRALQIALPSDAWLQECLLQASVAQTRCLLKLTVTRGIATARGYRPSGEEQCTVIVARHPWPEAVVAPLRVELSAVQLGHNALLAGIKHLNRLEQVLAQRQLGPGCDEVVLRDQAGQVICGSMSNLFICEASGLLTPDLRLCGVLGIVRAQVLAAATSLSIPVRTAPVSLATLQAAPACFFTNVRLGVCPAASFQGRMLAVDARVTALQRWVDAHAV